VQSHDQFDIRDSIHKDHALVVKLVAEGVDSRIGQFLSLEFDNPDNMLEPPIIIQLCTFVLAEGA
jgi:hypothetical protein